MNWRERTWEFVVYALSWIVALVALACVAIYVAAEAAKRHHTQRASRKAKVQQAPSSSLQMEPS